MRCPKCRGNKVKSTKWLGGGGAGHVAGSLNASGHPVLAAGVLALKAIQLANNWLRHEYACESCGHEFSISSGACRECTATTANMYDTYCCKTRLCESCVGEYNRPSNTVCAYCAKPVVRR
jgi:hypothetical protein